MTLSWKGGAGEGTKPVFSFEKDFNPEREIAERKAPRD